MNKAMTIPGLGILRDAHVPRLPETSPSDEGMSKKAGLMVGNVQVDSANTTVARLQVL